MPRTEKRVEFLTDVLITAVEGGINYWALVADYVPEGEPEKRGVTLWETEDDPEGNGEGVRVTLDTIASGIAKIRANKEGKFDFAHAHNSYWVQFWVANRTNGDDGDYDAGIADCILQAGLFGEVVYG